MNQIVKLLGVSQSDQVVSQGTLIGAQFLEALLCKDILNERVNTPDEIRVVGDAVAKELVACVPALA